MSTQKDYIYYMPSTFNEFQKDSSKILSDLGKPTMRGIKKCFKCGIYNGTRGVMCKNKQCDAVFKDCTEKEKSKVNLDAVKLMSGTFRQVFSVRVRDTGPDYRGFVQLPLLQSNSSKDSNLLSDVALCFVDSCQRLFDDSILHCHELEVKNTSPLCIHIKSALISKVTAEVLEFKRDLLHSLHIDSEYKEKLWLLASDKEIPLVQRISRNVMAVKCQVNPKNPLGYLHFSFLPLKIKDNMEKYCCSCTEFMRVNSKSTNVRFKCIHYYACIWALASHTKYSEEFVSFISLELSIKKPLEIHERFIDGNNGRNGRTSVIHHIEKHKVKPKELVQKKLKKTSKIVDSRNISQIRRLLNKRKLQYRKLNPKPPQINDCFNRNMNSKEVEVSWNFLDWLSSVTEAINESINIENCGVLNTLVFHIPKEFLESFLKRVPTECFPNSNRLLFQNVLQINSILHLKHIFDSPKVKLTVSKPMNSGPNYDSHNQRFVINFNLENYTSDDNSIENSFIIDWIPNILNITKLGQLKLQYKFIIKVVSDDLFSN